MRHDPVCLCILSCMPISPAANEQSTCVLSRERSPLTAIKL